MKERSLRNNLIKGILISLLVIISLEILKFPAIKLLQSYAGVREFVVRDFYVSPSDNWYLQNVVENNNVILFGIISTSRRINKEIYDKDEDASYYFKDSNNKREISMTLFSMGSDVIMSNIIDNSVSSYLVFSKDGMNKKYKYYFLPKSDNKPIGYYLVEQNILILADDEMTFSSFFENYEQL